MPAELFFRRDETLWLCPAEGGAPAPIPMMEGTQDNAIIGYRIAEERPYVVYATNANEMFGLDRTTGQTDRLPTAGRLVDENGIAHLAVSADGGTVYYLGWGIQEVEGPAEGNPGTAALFAVNAVAPRRPQQTLGFCRRVADVPCQGFSLSPEERVLAFIDGHGVWRIDRAAPTAPQLLAVVGDDSITIQSWSPTGAWLLLEKEATGEPAAVLLSTDAQTATLNISPLCSAPCEIGATWTDTVLWMTWTTPSQGCIQSLDSDQITASVHAITANTPICSAGPFALYPRSPQAVQSAVPLNASVTFLQPRVPGLGSGIYAFEPPETLLAVALLPNPRGSLLWSRDGEAFLHLDETGSALHMGSITASDLWQVETLLGDAEDFAWSNGTDE